MNAQARLFAYMNGWRDGAGGKALIDSGSALAVDYIKGHTAGRMARGAEMRRYAAEIGASVNALRAQESAL